MLCLNLSLFISLTRVTCKSRRGLQRKLLFHSYNFSLYQYHGDKDHLSVLFLIKRIMSQSNFTPWRLHDFHLENLSFPLALLVLSSFCTFFLHFFSSRIFLQTLLLCSSLSSLIKKAQRADISSRSSSHSIRILHSRWSHSWEWKKRSFFVSFLCRQYLWILLGFRSMNISWCSLFFFRAARKSRLKFLLGMKRWRRERQKIAHIFFCSWFIPFYLRQKWRGVFVHFLFISFFFLFIEMKIGLCLLTLTLLESSAQNSLNVYFCLCILFQAKQFLPHKRIARRLLLKF